MGFVCVCVSHYFFFLILRRDRAKAVDILVKDLKVFAGFNEDLFKEITLLLTLDDFRFLTAFDPCTFLYALYTLYY